MPLRFSLFVLLLVATLVGLDVWTRLSYRSEATGLAAKAARVNATTTTKANLVILGTCLPEQQILGERLADRLGVKVHNLGQGATSPLDWYFTYAHELDRRRVDGLVLAYGANDLGVMSLPYESRVMDLARRADMALLVDDLCGDDSACAADLYLRWAWPTWRYRIRIANRVWRALDALPDTRGQRQQRVVTGEAPLRYVRRLAAAARADGVPVFFLPLPRNPAAPGLGDARRDDARIAEEEGAARIELASLPPRYFESDVHLEVAGKHALTDALGDALAGKIVRRGERSAASGPAR